MNHTSICVLPREVFMATKWVFRAAQIPAGYGIAACELIQYAELYHGIGLQLLQQQLPIFEHQALIRPTLLAEAGNVALMDGGGQSVLINGPGALDLACANAKESGWGLVQVKRAGHGLALVEQLAHQAAQRGLICLLMTGDAIEAERLWGAKRSIIAFPAHEAPLIVNVALPAPSQSYVQLTNMLEQPDLSHFRLESAHNLFANALMAAEEGLTNGLDNRFLIFCLNPNAVGHTSEIVEQLLNHLDFSAKKAPDYPESFIQQPAERIAKQQTAHQEGLTVDYAIWSEVKQFGNRILVPVSVST